MKKLITLESEIGPFENIIQSEFAYICDDVIFQRNVIGECQIVDYIPEPEVPVKVVPAKVTMRQARLALLAAGKLSDVNTSINNLPSPQKEAAQIEWEFSSVVERNRDFVKLLTPVLGFTEEEMDSLFINASKL